jgi:hypothetical protein
MISLPSFQAKKSFLVLGLVLVVFVASLALHIIPSNFFSGISSCGKLKNQILSEEQIGKVLWSDYYSNWMIHEQNPTDLTNSSSLINSLIDVFESDQRVYDFAYEKPGCFSPTKNAYVRTQKTETVLIIKNLKTWINSGNLFNQDFYPKYYSFYDDSNPSPSPTLHTSSI